MGGGGDVCLCMCVCVCMYMHVCVQKLGDGSGVQKLGDGSGTFAFQCTYSASYWLGVMRSARGSSLPWYTGRSSFGTY